MYAYNLLVTNTEGGYDQVRPGPDMEIPTMAELQAQVKADLGFVPGWLKDCPPGEYIGVEDEHQVFPGGAFHDRRPTWFVLDIEGSEEHVLPPVTRRVAWARAARQEMGPIDRPSNPPETKPLAHYASGLCGRCGAIITLAEDGAWEDESGACGCGSEEHDPNATPEEVQS